MAKLNEMEVTWLMEGIKRTRDGLHQQLADLDNREQELREMFHIPSNGAQVTTEPVVAVESTSEEAKPKAGHKGRRKMTAAQRSEVSRRLKKYWAERRKAKESASA